MNKEMQIVIHCFIRTIHVHVLTDVEMVESCTVQKQDIGRKQRKRCNKWLGRGGSKLSVTKTIFTFINYHSFLPICTVCVCTTILFVAGVVHVMTPGTV